jgi:methyl acetate hydrolase
MCQYMALKGIPSVISCWGVALDLPLVFNPDERWDCGIGIDWVSKAVERASGKQVGDYFAEHLFAPAGMTDAASACGRTSAIADPDG